jgi:anti-sigma B factor antagonist
MPSFSTRAQTDVLVLALEGANELNDYRSTTFRDELFQAVQPLESPRIAVDLGAIDYLSSTGVAILVGLKRRVDQKQGQVVLFRLQPPVLDLLRCMKLHTYFTVADDEAGALAALRPLPTA